MPLDFGAGAGAADRGLASEPPGWDGIERSEPGIHGVARARRWDAVETATAPGLRGDVVHFVSLPDGTLVVEEDEPDGALTPLADAVEGMLPSPYRAEAVRRGPETWAVAASRISVAELRGLRGDRAELIVTRDGRTLQVDGRTTLGRAPALEQVGAGQGSEYVVRAERLDGELWQVEATPL
ncbi:MAG TPA: hypothetical protein VNC40_08585 [Gaiellaceae bacterium]|nr:hypothetical protein [Gaiellaceae bacterium]